MVVINVSQNHRNTQYDAAKDQWYVEPRWCVEQLADAIELVDGSYVWDPCCGGGTIPAVLADRIGKHRIFATDLVDRGSSQFHGEWDATSYGVPNCIKPGMRLNVVTNPPFNLAESIVRRALPLVDYQVCILQQLSFLASIGRHALFTEFPPTEILILSKRPSMPPGDKIVELGDKAFKGGVTDFCWIVWTKPHNRETRVRWLPPVLS